MNSAIFGGNKVRDNDIRFVLFKRKLRMWPDRVRRCAFSSVDAPVSPLKNAWRGVGGSPCRGPFPSAVIYRSLKIHGGAQGSFRAAHSLHRLTHSRPATDLTSPWCREFQSTALNWQPGAGGLTPGTAQNEQRYTTHQRLVHDTDARQRRNGVAQGARWAVQAGRRGTVGSLGLPYSLKENA